jgi:hypothetical protein
VLAQASLGQKRKRRATWAALQIIRVHLLNIYYHIWGEVQYPLLSLSENLPTQFFPKPQKRKRRATWAALQIIRVHLLNIYYHIWSEVQYPLLSFI